MMTNRWSRHGAVRGAVAVLASAVLLAAVLVPAVLAPVAGPAAPGPGGRAAPGARLDPGGRPGAVRGVTWVSDGDGGPAGVAAVRVPPVAPSAAAPLPPIGLRLTYGLGIYLNLTGLQVRTTAVAVTVAGVTGCLLGSRLPSGPAAVVGQVCVLAGVAGARVALHVLVDRWRAGSVVDSWCYQVRLVPASTTLSVVPVQGNCRA